MTNMTSLTNNLTAPESSPAGSQECHLSDAGDFIADYTAWLWGCGATCLRIEKNSGRIARAIGYDICITIMPKHITLTLKDSATNTQVIYQRQMVTCGINFDLNTRLSSLSWKIADKKIPYCQARAMFEKIISTRYPSTQITVLLTSLANASFCRLFGGDAIAMLVVFVATFAGFELKNMLIRARLDIRLVFMACAFVSTVIATGAQLFGWGTTPDTAIATSVLYLIPGVPYINSASDLIDRHYLCSLSRFMDACVLTACLSIGLCAGLSLMGINHI